MTLTEAFAVLTRNGFTPDEKLSYENEWRTYARSVEVSVNQYHGSIIPKAEVMFSKVTGIVARAGNLPKE